MDDPANEAVFISEPNANAIERVRRVLYHPPKPDQAAVHPVARDFDVAARRAEAVAGVARNVRQLGFKPDVIIGHHGWGELLELCDVFPDVPMLGYFEFYYSPHGQDVGYDPEFPTRETEYPRIRAMNIVNFLALALNQHGQTPTQWQLSRYPDWAQARIKLLPEGARLDVCKPDPKAHAAPLKIKDFTIGAKDKLVTYVARNLEPYRGFHVMMRALPDLLRARPDLKVVMVGGDEVSYGARLASGTWRQHFMGELAGKFDASRVCFPGQVDYDTYLKLLQRTDAHVYLSYPFVPSWSLREAMAIGCPIVAADVEPVREFITDGKTGLIVPGLDPKAVATRVLEVMEDAKLARKLRTAARRHAEEHLDMNTHIAAYETRIREIVGAPNG